MGPRALSHALSGVLGSPTALHVRFDAVDDCAVAHDDEARRAHLGGRGRRDFPRRSMARASTTRSSRSTLPTSSATCASSGPAPSVKSLTDWDWTGMASAVVPLRDAHGGNEGWTALARLPVGRASRSLSPGQAASRSRRRKPETPGGSTFSASSGREVPRTRRRRRVRRLVRARRAQLPRAGGVPAVQASRRND